MSYPYNWFAYKLQPYGLNMHDTLNYDDWRDGRAYCALIDTTGEFSYTLFTDLEDRDRHGFAYNFFKEYLGVPKLLNLDDWNDGGHPDDEVFYIYMFALRDALDDWYSKHFSLCSLTIQIQIHQIQIHQIQIHHIQIRSEERRVGKEC